MARTKGSSVERRQIGQDHDLSALEADGDFEFEQKLKVAKDIYLKGASIEETAQQCEISKWSIRRYVMQSVGGEPSWAEQRRLARTEFVKECGELTKISLSQAYRSTSEVLFKCLNRLAKDLDDGKMQPYEVIKAADTLLRGAEKLHGLFMPAMKQPLVNIALQQQPTMTEIDIKEQLKDWGLDSEDDACPGK